MRELSIAGCSSADAWDGCEGEVSGVEMPGRGVKGESSVEEPVQVFQVVCNVAVVGDVQDEACGSVLHSLQSLLEFGRGSCVEGIVVVQLAAYKGLGDCSSGFGGYPFVDLSEHAEGVKQEEEMALTCWVMDTEGSKMNPRLHAELVGVGVVPRVAGHQESSHAEGWSRR
ncbi:hypothetical protein NDU88_007027 [Pleurodeles waltl]|uniref:Uncharacterized protein n=1 Tax=Pleurodeles waltl TaxID=8319 RepID=A0AAV7UPA5_PLEWA|nr:hypothetical protein NDU88_007027 [Pleurodeles waltl]